MQFWRKARSRIEIEVENEDHKEPSPDFALSGAITGEANMKAMALDRRLSAIEKKHPPRDRQQEKIERVISRCTDEELVWITEHLKDGMIFDNPENEKLYWDIMRRHGWFDEPD